MDVSTASAARYSADEYLATYLHAEWWDLLCPAHERRDRFKAPEVDPEADEGGPGSFYRRLGDVTADWARGLTCDVAAVCDIGGGTGRMTFELASRFPGATERVLIEPSSWFCQWAGRLLLREDFDGWIPMPLDSGRPGYRRIDHDRLPRVVPHPSIHNTTAAGVPRPQDHFDVVTCLNVVDRVEDPGETVHVVGRLVKPGGLLVLASPHHFTPEFTPEHKWVTGLRELLDAGEWTVNDGECDACRDFTYYRRHHSHFVSQVIGAVRKG